VIVLASKSPTRSALLTGAGVAFETASPGVDEDAVKVEMLARGATPRDVAAALAERKALRVSAARPGLIIGADQMRDMRVDVFPEFAPPIVEIQTPCLGLSPTEVEALVTIPIEQALAGVPELDILRSKSVTDLSSVKLIFRQGADAMAARQRVQEGMALITGVIPRDVGPPVMLRPAPPRARTSPGRRTVRGPARPAFGTRVTCTR